MINHYFLLIFCSYPGVIESIPNKVLEEEELGVFARKVELGVLRDVHNMRLVTDISPCGYHSEYVLDLLPPLLLLFLPASSSWQTSFDANSSWRSKSDHNLSVSFSLATEQGRTALL
jgi:hypothetical protein